MRPIYSAGTCGCKAGGRPAAPPSSEPSASAASTHGCAVLAQRRLSKSGGSRSIAAGQGSIAFTAAARSEPAGRLRRRRRRRAGAGPASFRVTCEPASRSVLDRQEPPQRLPDDRRLRPPVVEGSYPQRLCALPALLPETPGGSGSTAPPTAGTRAAHRTRPKCSPARRSTGSTAPPAGNAPPAPGGTRQPRPASIPYQVGPAAGSWGRWVPRPEPAIPHRLCKRCRIPPGAARLGQPHPDPRLRSPRHSAGGH